MRLLHPGHPYPQGAAALRKVGLTQAQIGRKVGVSQALAAKWLAGARRPNALARRRLHEVFDIDPKLWATEAEDPAAAPNGAAHTNGTAPASPAVPDDAWTPAEFRSRAAKLQRSIDMMLEEAGTMDAIARMNAIKTCTSAMQILGRMTGELQQWDEARILRFPAVRRVHERILDALKPHPNALEAVAQVLAEMAATS